MLRKTKKILKADASIELDNLEKDERSPTEFEYLRAKVGAMEDIISKLQDIVKQNGLKYVTEDIADGDMEDMAWRTLEDEDD